MLLLCTCAIVVIWRSASAYHRDWGKGTMYLISNTQGNVVGSVVDLGLCLSVELEGLGRVITADSLPSLVEGLMLRGYLVS